NGVTVVISPLLEVAGLRRKGVTVVSYTSETPPEDKAEIMKETREGVYQNRLLYITPESMCTNGILHVLNIAYKAGSLNRLVVDEWSSSVRIDIIRSLGMSETNLFQALHPFNRENLFYEASLTSTLNGYGLNVALGEVHSFKRRTDLRQRDRGVYIEYAPAKRTICITKNIPCCWCAAEQGLGREAVP
ncbi:hypothetical protein CPB85DRAFT_1321736, partial [Mucidula mucida]